MHARTLSSRKTFFAKFIFAPFLVVIGLLAVAILGHAYGSAKSDAGLSFVSAFLVLWLGLAALFISRIIRWKRVRIDTASFYISNYFKQIHVPLNQLSGVSEQRRFGARTIALSFRPGTAFGEVVRFKPRTYPWLWRAHPVVTELQAIAAGTPLTQAELDQAIARDRKRLLTGIALFSALFLAFFLALQWSLTHSEPYRLGLEALNRSSDVVDVLGAPVEPGWLSSGQISYGPESGCAAFQVGLHGSHSKGDAAIYAFEANGQWQLYHVWLQPDGRSDRIEILNNPPTGSGKRCMAGPDCQGADTQPAQAAKAKGTSKCSGAG